jgi:hypothetical protein
VRGQVHRRRHGHELEADERPRDDTGLEVGAGPQRDVVPVPAQIDVHGGQVSLQPHLRVGCGKLGDEVEERDADEEWKRHPKVAAHRGVARPDARFGLLDGVDGDARVAIERLPGVGDRQAARRPAQETRAQPLFESGQASAQGRARHAQLGRRPGERPRLGGLREGEKLGGLERLVHLDQIIAAESHSALIVTTHGLAQISFT